MEKNKKYERAKKRVESLKGLYIHLFVYLVTNIILFTINMLNNPDEKWFIYPLLGWGIGLFAHFISVYFEGKLGLEWGDKKIKELMQKDKRED